MDKKSKIFVAGHRGMVGSAALRALLSKGYKNIVTRTHAELDLTRQADVEDFFRKEKPEFVFLAAAKVGGILANDTYKAEFIFKNILISRVRICRKNLLQKKLLRKRNFIFAIRPLLASGIPKRTAA